MIDLNKKISTWKTLPPLAALIGLILAVGCIVYSLQSYAITCFGASKTEPSNIRAAILVAAGYLPLLFLCLFFYVKTPKEKAKAATAAQWIVVACIITLAADFYFGAPSHLDLSCAQGWTF